MTQQYTGRSFHGPRVWTSRDRCDCIRDPTNQDQSFGPARENVMANAHLASLNARHARLEESVATETRRPMPDQALLAKLKRERLKVKEEAAEAARALGDS